MYGEWVTLPELNGNVIARVFVPCTPGTAQHKLEAKARGLLRSYLERLDELALDEPTEED